VLALQCSRNSRFPFFRDIYENRFLFWAVIIGALSVFPAVYIPSLNTKVFKHVGISWEWGLSFGAVFVFVLGVEAWKAVKRSTGWFIGEEENEEERRGGKFGLRQGFWGRARSRASSIRSLKRWGTDVSDNSGISGKVAEMGVLGAAPTTRSLLTTQRDEASQV
jgi:Na+-exporting ATPase